VILALGVRLHGELDICLDNPLHVPQTYYETETGLSTNFDS